LGRAIEKLGLVLDHQRGSHLIHENSDGRIVTIPHHAGEEIGPGLPNKIIKKDLGMTREEFVRPVR
jgi:predicted RNA binding protein YcfA (HicA-like mRNA interferase family)